MAESLLNAVMYYQWSEIIDFSYELEWDGTQYSDQSDLEEYRNTYLDARISYLG